MLQSSEYFFCVYLFFKGVEILQQAVASDRRDRGGALVIGILSLIGCSLAAGIFFLILMAQGSAAIRILVDTKLSSRE